MASGELEASARDLLATGLVTPWSPAAPTPRLRLRLEDVPGVVALGWRDDITALVRAAACVVQNAGRMTSLESLAAGTPTLTYRPIPGHGTTNAEVLHVAGLVPRLGDAGQLVGAVRRVLASPESSALPQGAPERAARLGRAAPGPGDQRAGGRGMRRPAALGTAGPAAGVATLAPSALSLGPIRRALTPTAASPALSGISDRPHIALTFDDGARSGIDTGVPADARPARRPSDVLRARPAPR